MHIYQFPRRIWISQDSGFGSQEPKLFHEDLMGSLRERRMGQRVRSWAKRHESSANCSFPENTTGEQDSLWHMTELRHLDHGTLIDDCGKGTILSVACMVLWKVLIWHSPGEAGKSNYSIAILLYSTHSGAAPPPTPLPRLEDRIQALKADAHGVVPDFRLHSSSSSSSLMLFEAEAQNH